MLTHLRIAAFAGTALAAVWVGQAFAFWPFGADPARVDLEPAYAGVCEGCDLSGRILVGARMSNSVFSGANFTSAVLARADASRSRFENADFTDADLSRARLVGARCPRANFDGATLTQADARGADFTRARFGAADVTRANFEDANLSGADLSSVEGLTQAQLDEACGDSGTQLPVGLTVQACG